MKMGNLRLEIWFSKVILVILYLDCLGSCAHLSQREFAEITENGLSEAHRRWIRPESRSVSARSRSDLEASPSLVNATTEAELLLEFRKGVTRDPLNVLSGWNSNNYSNYCNWTGVQCSSSNGQVSALNLTGRQLTGSISPLLGGLQFLQSLDLSNNFFDGTIPPSIANCSYLTVLNLSQNGVSGSIPLELGALSNLEELHLSNNALTGLPSSISNLSALRVLNVERNQLQGDIMSIAWGALGRLETLDLGYNEISGGIPESLSNCSNLVDLRLNYNDFDGTLLNMFETLQKLQYLDLSVNGFIGSIPLSLSTLQKLQYLDLSVNGFIGSIPRSLSTLTNLSVLGLDDNLLSGEIPQELGNLKNLTVLNLSNNSFTGSIPVSLLNCSSLSVLLLYSNQLVGEIPAHIGILSQLQLIYLWNNNLTGSIPTSLANCTSLVKIIFNNNFFSGEIPSFLGMLPSLEFLYLHWNYFVGAIPPSLGNCSRLQELILHNNLELIGVIPSELGQLKNLSRLDLSSNFLSGLIPTSLGDSPALLTLFLAKNQLTGVIPSSFGGLTKLQGLNIADNRLTGGIPPELSNCTQLFELDLSGNFLTGNIPDELVNLMALSILYLNNNNLTGSISSAIRQRSTNLLVINLAYNSLIGDMAGYDFYGLRNLQVSLDLSHNLFTGPLPPGIGALRFVQKINFSFNAFSGAIPDGFSQCTGLELLDLSSNNLDGQIPPSLTTLQHLTYFNVSFNQLTGSVPSQFNNFSGGSFLGNPNLCGPMLSNKCGSKCHGIHCHKLWIIIIPAVAAGIAGALALVGIWFLFIAKMSDRSGMVVPALPNASHFTSEYENLSMGDIVAATNGFSDGSIIGVGAKSTVFAGVLPSGIMIAVKRLELRNDDRANGKLYRGLQRLSKVEHPNLLKVHGLFSTGDLKVLVLEYMPNGSLHKQLYDGENCRLTWAQRLNIALGVAEAMVHLHHASSKPIIHQDLKPSNILLDSDMEPKVGDYGISSFLNHESHGDTTISSNLYGTIGYIPPEYGALTSVSTMGDVYNFGVVLMELFTRKQPTDDTFGQEASLRSWVVDAFPSRISQVLDPTLRQELAQNEQDVGIHLMVRLAIACTRNVPKERPTMIQARDMLMEIKSIELFDKSGPLISQ